LLERDFKRDAFSQRQRAITKNIPAEPDEPKRTPQVLAVPVLAPGTRRLSPWISFKLIDRVDFSLHVGGCALHLNRNRVHQRFERSRIVREPGDEIARLRRSRNHDFPRKTLDRQIGGIEDVTVRVDDAVDPGRRRLRQARCRQCGFTGHQCDTACDKVTSPHRLPRANTSKSYLAWPDCPGVTRLQTAWQRDLIRILHAHAINTHIR
jgi:hypothetical protein